MQEEIINRVANSSLITIDLEDWYPQGKRVAFDLSPWLFEGIILREKEFREHVKEHDWTQYQDAYVTISCSTEAILPGWAFMLITSAMIPYANKVVCGTEEDLETTLFQDLITTLNIETYHGKPIIIKGCSNKPIPQSAYLELLQKLQPVAKSIHYGEACSSVPIYKKPRK